MDYLSTWITPNEKHWFPQTFPSDNHTVYVEITTIIHLNIPLHLHHQCATQTTPEF